MGKKAEPPKEEPKNEEPPPDDKQEEQKKAIDTSKLSTINKIIYPLAAGVAATALVHPFDVWKLNRQINIMESGPKISVLERLFKDRGWRGFTPGISANLISQALYVLFRSAAHGGITKDLDSLYSENAELNDQAKTQLMSNMTGALMSTPAELALVSVATDRQQPPRFRKYYSGGYNSILRTLSAGGILGSFRGGVTTVARTGLASMCNFVIYNQVKDYLKKSGILKGEVSSTTSSLVLSSLVTSLVTLPVDVLKTRYQTMRTCGGRPEFCGIAPLANSIRKSGLKNFFRGFVPYTIRIGLFNFAMVGFFNAFLKIREFIVGEDSPPPKEEPKPEESEDKKDTGKDKKGKGKKKWRR